MFEKDKKNIFHFCYRKAFTLAEVLITLAIIGVVAAMTTPILMSNVQEKKVYPALAKFSSTMSNGFTQMLQDTDAANLSDFDAQTAYSYYANPNSLLFNTLSSYVSIEPFQESYTVRCSGCSQTIEFGNHYTYRLKDGTVFYYDGLWHSAYESNLKRIIGRFYVDINGSKKPNVAGVDVFSFYLANSGHLFPAGSDYVEDSTRFFYICKKKTAVYIGDNFACTADIMEKK